MEPAIARRESHAVVYSRLAEAFDKDPSRDRDRPTAARENPSGPASSEALVREAKEFNVEVKHHSPLPSRYAWQIDEKGLGSGH